jgi:hypothetical protein
MQSGITASQRQQMEADLSQNEKELEEEKGKLSEL